jgi:signal transduction histidine kinase
MQPLHTFQCSHGLLLVVLSYLISAFGSYCALQFALQIRPLRGRQLVGQLVPAAVAMGGGAIWSMHFIAMISCWLPFAVTYDPLLTFASLLLAVLVTGVGLYAVGSQRRDSVRFLVGGTFTGLGIVTMHYMGVAAMRMPARIIWHRGLILASILIAIAAAMLALWLAFNLRSGLPRFGSAFVMAGAVCGMHYAGMEAAVFVPLDQSLTVSRRVHGSDELGFMVFGVTLLVLALLLMESRVTEIREHSKWLNAFREEERSRIARQVHDEIGQMLTVLRMDVAWLENRLEPREEITGKLQTMIQNLDTTLDTVQRITTELRPAILDHLGLEAAVEWYVEELEKRTGISCRLSLSLGGTTLDAERSIVLFRILQEALTNVVRHAEASEVEIRLAREGSRVILKVTDNGRGIAGDKITDARSLGLLGMRERARALGGDVVIRRAPGQGTTVEARIPL